MEKNSRTVRLRRLLLAALIGVLLAGCANPFDGSENDYSDSDSGTGSVEISLGTLSASSIVPDVVSTVDQHRVTLTRDGHNDITQSVAAESNGSGSITLTDVPVGTWEVLVESLDTDQDPNAVVGQSDGTHTVTVAQGSTAPVGPISATPTTGGSGVLELTVSWPESEVTEIGEDVLIRPDSSVMNISFNLTGTPVTGATYSNTSVASGSYTLRLTLQRNSGPGQVDVATIIEAVHIYDNVTTQGTIALTSNDIAQPPAAPTGVSAAASSTSGSDTIDLSWTDNSNTETGFEVERSEDGGSSWSSVTATAANASTYGDSGLASTTTYTYRLRAVNDFGRSSWVTGAQATTDAPQFLHVSHSGSDTTGTGSAVAPYATIAHALSEATAGSNQEIRVAGSDTGEVYAENQDLTIPNSIDVSGGWDPSFTAPGSSTYITTVHLPITDNIDVSGNSDLTELSHFTLEIIGARTSRMQGVYVSESEVTIDSVSVTVINNKEEAVGIHIVTTDDAANVTISNSEIVARSPDHPDNNAFEAYSYGLWIRDNTFSTGGEASSSVTVTSTDITTESRNSDSYTVYLDDFTGTASFDGGTWNPTASTPGVFSLAVRGLFQNSSQDSDIAVENVTISGNYASGHDSMGIQITGDTAGSTFSASNNTIIGSKYGFFTNSFSYAALTITGNTFEIDDTPDGSNAFAEVFGLSLRNRGNTVIRENVVTVSSGALFAVGMGIDLPSGTLLVANNVIWRQDDGGTGNFTGIDFEHSVDGASEILNNTIVESRSAPSQSRALELSVGLPDFVNNLVSGGFSVPVYEISTSQGTVDVGLFQNNHLDGAGSLLYRNDDGGTFYSTITDIETNVGSTASGNVTALATGFADGATGDFDLTASTASGLRQGGLDLSGTFDVDYDGITRSTGGANGTAWSIGAHEY